MKLLLYCTKAKPYLYPHFNNLYFTKNKDFGNVKLNGKIVAECDFEVEEIKCVDDGYFVWYEGKTLDEDKLLKQSCLNETELFNYLKSKFGYAIHIKNLHIFGKPRELSDYLNNKYWNSHFGNDRVSKAPQNMMRVYKLKDIEWEEYILISIQPQWLCKILNGEKTIEVRKKVLKEMLE